MVQRLASRALLAATAVAALAAASPASAQRVDRIVTFGDSYADDGNVLPLNGLNPLTFQNGIYRTGRFSGGTNYVDTLSQLLNAPVENFALGGASATGTAPLPATQTRPASTGSFSLQYQVDQFLNVGAQRDDIFPTGTPSFDKNDLVTVSIGGNDARYFQRGEYVSQTGQPLTVNDAIAATRTQLDRLVAAGAPTISFLAGNTAELPEPSIVNDPAARAVRNTFSTTFNAGIQSTLAGYANNGVIVHYLDLSQVLARIRANGAAYGLPNGVTCPATASNVVGGCAGFLFYVDDLHLSSDGFRVVGQYVQRQLQAPLSIGATSDLALDTARQFGRVLNGRMDLGSPRDGEVLEGVRLFVVGDSSSRDVGMSDVTDAFDLDSVGGSAGVEFGLGTNGLVGVAANYSRARAKFSAQPTRVEGNAMQLGAYASFALGPIFVQGHGAAGRTNYEISRAGVIDNLSADPEGSHVVAGAKAGFLAPLGGFRVGPVATLDYARASVDGYTEEGDAALALNVGKQRYSALVGGLGLELRGDFDASGTSLRPFASAMIEKDLKGDSRTLVFSQTSAPTIVNRFDAGERDQGYYSRFSGGASAAISQAIQLDVLASATVGKDQGNELSTQVGLRVGF